MSAAASHGGWGVLVALVTAGLPFLTSLLERRDKKRGLEQRVDALEQRLAELEQRGPGDAVR
jgi:hypothetical protein